MVVLFRCKRCSAVLVCPRCYAGCAFVVLPSLPTLVSDACSGSFLEMSWKFYGFTRGEICVLGMEAFPTTRTFGAFWVSAGRIVGAFLEVWYDQ